MVRVVTRALSVICWLAACVCLPWGLARVFFYTPIEQQMGTAQKIFYFHVPLAWIMMLAAVISGVAAAVQLARRSRVAEATAQAAAELVLLCGAGVLITGPIWGDATWGTPWTWDARQVTTGLLWLVFAAYALLQRFGGPGSDRLAAAMAVFGALDVPIIYRAVKIWKTTHPTTDVVGSLPSIFWAALGPCLAGLTAVCVGLFMVRVSQLRAMHHVDAAWLRRSESFGAA